MKGICTVFLLVMMSSILRSQNVGIGTTSPVARLHVADSGVVFTGPPGIPPNPSEPAISGSGVRFLWYPDKAALRAGRVFGSNWNKDSIGFYSVATGLDCKAKGIYSVALGTANWALGMASVAIGDNNRASGRSATALGYNTTASAEFATALGYYSTASGFASNASGNLTTASGDYSTALGNITIASGDYSTALGNTTIASGDYSTALGSLTLARGDYSTAVGNNTAAKAPGGFTIGEYNDPFEASSPSVRSASDRLFQIGNGIEGARTNAITVLRSGYTGIGTTIPVYRLDIHGRIRIRSGGSDGISAGIFLNKNDNTLPVAFVGMANDSVIGFWGSAAGFKLFMSTQTGFTGIGTPKPLGQLHVFTGSSGFVGTPYSPVVVESPGNAYINFLTPNVSESGILFGKPQNVASGGILYNSFTKNGIEFRTNGNNIRMVIDSAGNVGIGTPVAGPAPGATLDVRRTNPAGTANLYGSLYITHFAYGADEHTYIRGGKEGSNVIINDLSGNVGIGTTAPGHKLEVDGHVRATSFISSSDERYKENIKPLHHSLEKILKLQGVSYDFTREFQKEESDGLQIGFVAQQMEHIIPELVQTGSDGYKGIDYAKLTAVLTEAIKEQQVQINELQNQNAEQYKLIKELKKVIKNQK